MTDKACPACDGNLSVWDTAIHKESPHEALVWVGEPLVWLGALIGCLAFLVSVVFSVVIYLLVGAWILHNHWRRRNEFMIYRCVECSAKFIGPELKKFEWSDYAAK